MHQALTNSRDTETDMISRENNANITSCQRVNRRSPGKGEGKRKGEIVPDGGNSIGKASRATENKADQGITKHSLQQKHGVQRGKKE